MNDFIHECLSAICAACVSTTSAPACSDSPKTCCAIGCSTPCEDTGVRNVLAAGGVFMNVKANKRIAELPEVDSFEAFPSCGDETLSIGGFYLEAARRFGDATVKPLEHFYLGDAPQDNDVLAAVKKSGFHYERPADMADAVAKLAGRGTSRVPAAPGPWSSAPGPGQSLDPGRSQIARRRAGHQSHGQECATSGCRSRPWSRKSGSTTISRIPSTSAARS